MILNLFEKFSYKLPKKKKKQVLGHLKKIKNDLAQVWSIIFLMNWKNPYNKKKKNAEESVIIITACLISMKANKITGRINNIHQYTIILVNK